VDISGRSERPERVRDEGRSSKEITRTVDELDQILRVRKTRSTYRHIDISTFLATISTFLALRAHSP
jgi:hypothetical protein